MDLADRVAALRAEAERANERRLLTLAGDRGRGLDAARDVLDAMGDPAATVVTTGGGGIAGADHCHPDRADRLLGTTRDAVVLDCHAGFSANVLGRVVGAVDGGGLLVLVTPPLDEWPGDDYADERLAVPPYTTADVTGHFRRRLVDTLRAHPGVAVVDVDAGIVERDGLTDPPPARPRTSPSTPDDATASAAAYDACLTSDQADALHALEGLRDGAAVVVEADRGRGKSAAAGLAAGSLAAEGRDVLVTAPAYRNAAEVFERAEALLSTLGRLENADDETHDLTATGGGRVRFTDPAAAVDLPGDPDALIVDEAAALPVRRLAAYLDAPAVAFVTTVHGYEGTGRGFDVRFRDRLAESDHAVIDVRLDEPIRYAAGDPVEIWAFRALLLDARPAADQLVADATPADATYRALDAAALLADEHLLREAFGLLVLAHYRTEPDDLARLLDAPNLDCRALCIDGHVAAVALLAREGGLPESLRVDMYEGARVRGNMLPDVLTSQLRDIDGGTPVGYRVLRIATHHAIRSTGFGSRLLAACHDEFDADVDWFGVGYGATPRLVRFWERNGYRTVHCSTTRNATSGEYSAIMLRPTSPAGHDLHDRHARRFCARMRDGLSDALDDLDPDVARAMLRATDHSLAPDLTDHEWRVVTAAAYGPGLYDAAPGAFRNLAMAHLTDPVADLSARAERLLVRKPLQAHSWERVAADLDYVSTRQCMRALGEAYRPLVDRYGPEAAREERRRYEERDG
ncbi:tRNA(Met) cytidine acetyltransferase TmcA [Haloplanus aerogenes]|uniref:tRNA(Met) cytidine acetyltransferase TmcA n=1 Tax=Haloplanus aerogenes TaxID=660522 RepID=A0A3M0CXV4_9EURY|nr:tRNA(Met) cytidine acetyltransferase TmcA [Haloplanus aerogenes]AZH25198.1 tRNA(Met) cytidine acetyltransferase [Haloplanus aerogenes]RMB13575.1 tRNA(Met) cytidine acetyltransferase [Haloplanus aerogenes]